MEPADRDDIQNLASVPSVVYGILGLAFLVRGPLSLGPVVLAGGLTLGLLVLPVVIIAAREAIRAVPPSIREGSLALGATQWQTIRRQVLPASIPRHRHGSDPRSLTRDRETAPLIVVGAATVRGLQPGRARLALHRAPDPDLQLDLAASNDINDYRPLAAAAILILMIMLLLMNSARDLAQKSL